MVYNQQQQAIIDEATRRAQANGTTPEREAWNYAQTNNMSPLAVDEFFGWGSGTTGKWGVDNGLAPAPQGNSYTPQQSSNLGMGGGGAPAGGASDTGFVNRQPASQPAPAPQQSGGAPGGGNLGMGYNPQQNPYLKQMGVDVGNQMFDQWSRNTLPSIRSGAMAAGGFGGSRQGVVEANGINDMNRQYGQALTGMYGQDWSQQQGRNLQQQGLNNSYELGLKSNDLQNKSVNNSYDLGLRSSDLGFANLDANINQNNFGNQMQAANFGLGVYNTMNNQTQTGINAGTQIQNTPLDYQKYFTNSANGVGSGYGTSSTSQTNQGNPWLGALGGAQIGNAWQYPKT